MYRGFAVLSLFVLAAASTALVGTAQEKTIPITGLADADLAPFDVMMLKFMSDNRVPGAAMAIAKDGRLIYARGFGHADSHLGRPVEPVMRFRVASVSKPITAAMILRLVELGLLTLDDNPFEFLKIALPPGTDPRLRKITLHHLLNHTAGWDRALSGDPMFKPIMIAKAEKVDPPARSMDIVHYMVRQKLDFEPGERYAYSNFGYCVLGRVIEKATGQDYQSAVQKHIFNPIGVQDTELGKTLTTARNEVQYFDLKNRQAKAIMGPNFGKLVPLAYGTWHLEAMDAHGGWISTAPDLVRFASALDDPEKCKILRPASLRAMFMRPNGPAGYGRRGEPRDHYYGYGWNVRPVGFGKANTWHSGLLDGTATLLVRRSDRLTWAVLFNASVNAQGTYLGSLIDPLMHTAASQVKRWPKKNLFTRVYKE